MANDLFTAIYEAGKDFAAKTGSRAIAAFTTGIDAFKITDALESLKQPSLCYIPIQSESLTMRRTADIGTTMLIAQTDQKKEYVTDNTAPRPRTWTGKGYITTLVPLLENGVVVKPSLQVQQAVLEAASDSRQPVKFKTDTGEVVDVLVQDLQVTSLPKGTNAKEVSYTVQEVKVLENSILLGTLDRALDTTGLNSIPIRAVVNLGKSSVIGSGVVNAASGLLSKIF